jgi:hypothetical protein
VNRELRPAEGRTGGFEPVPNRVVGVASFGSVFAPDLGISGSAILNDEFLTLLDAACARKAGNC